MNPFKSHWPIEDRSNWIGSTDVFEDLESCIQQRVNACILGVEGSGKSSLLNCFFTFSYRKEMAVKNKVLIFSADLSTRANGEDICGYLADQLRHSIERLLRGKYELPEIMAVLDGIRSESAVTRLQQMIDYLHEEEGYFVVLVMDSFELFTSSPSITMDHHEKLRSLIEARKIQCIVATNFDLSQDSLPLTVRGSYFIHKFTHTIMMKPFSESAAVTFVQQKQQNSNLKLDERTILALYRLSGGIPWVLEAAAECAYDNIVANAGVMDGKQTTKAIYETSLPIFRKWCELLTPYQVEALRIIADRAKRNDELAYWDFTASPQSLLNAAEAMKSRGILRQMEHVDAFGNLRKGPDYEVSFNSLLFQRFCRSGLAEEATKNNPLSGNADSAEPPVAQEIHYHFTGRNYFPGAQDNSQNIISENVHIHQGLTLKELFHILSTSGDSRALFAEQLSCQLQKCIPADSIPRLSEADADSEEELAQQYDLEYDKVGNQIVQDIEVDEDQELLNVSSDDLATLDARFREARNRCRADLSDELLEGQSERCQFYIKLSVVVEDALNFPKGFAMDDFSPQLVLYGKALEQALRDNFYELFHKEERLSVYDTYLHMEDSHSSRVFKNIRENETYIGNYAFLIAGMKNYLGDLCMGHNILPDSTSVPASWSAWWDQLHSDIHSARHIRNLTDHADEESPDKSKLDRMCELLFGSSCEQGILAKAVIGKRLSLRLFPPAIPSAVIQQLVGETCTIECTDLKKSGGMRGVTCKGGYIVNVSPRKVKKYCNMLSDMEFQPVGKIFTVTILEYKRQENHEFFSAELIEAVAKIED